MQLDSKPTLTFEIKQNDRNYYFTMPMGAPLGEAYDAAYMALQQIIKFAKEAEEAAKRVEKDKE